MGDNYQDNNSKRESNTRLETISFGIPISKPGSDTLNPRPQYPQPNFLDTNSDNKKEKLNNDINVKVTDNNLNINYPQPVADPENNPNNVLLQKNLFDSQHQDITASNIADAKYKLTIPDTQFNTGTQFHSNWMTTSEVKQHYPAVRINSENTDENILEPIPEDEKEVSKKEDKEIESFPQNPVFLKCPNCDGKICTYTKSEMKTATLKCVIIC